LFLVHMKPSSLIGHVCELLDLIRPLKQPADSIVRDFFRTRHYLGSKDRRFIAETLYAILRNYALVKFYAETTLQKFEALSATPIALYIVYAVKLHGDDRTAVLGDVESSWMISLPKISCADFIQTVIEMQFPPAILENPTKRIALTYSFPEPIVDEWIERHGEAETVKLCEALNQPAPTVIRVNTIKATVEECRSRLSGEGIENDLSLSSPFGLILKKRINVQAVQSYKDGLFEMQDEGSQLLSLLLEPKPGQTVVDSCAGGGGKTVHIAALMNNIGKLISIDIDEKRLRNIQPRLTRSGVTIAQLLHSEKDADAIAAYVRKADSVLVDAPCSGVGTFRRNPAAKIYFNQAQVDDLAMTQHNVLESYSVLVKPSGRLVYTTCTLLRKENEEIIETFLKQNPIFRVIPAAEILRRQGISVESSPDFLTFFPHRNGTDGFFAAVMELKP
jgi:16S rRNA (cytosine967-C5)-methyltransferase